MRRVFKTLLYILGAILVLLLGTYIFFQIKWSTAAKKSLAQLGPPSPTLSINGLEFRDLNKNGKLDLYEDHRQNVETRVNDLVSQMTVEEKAGLLFITMGLIGKDGASMDKPSLGNPFSLMLETTTKMIAEKRMNHFNVLEVPSAEAMARWNNNLQKLADRTRLGIPVTLATDPRHGKEMNIGTSISTRFFSRWPSQLGLAATRDSALVYEFGDIARQEYLAMGLRLALHPMADLATEPRWTRINGTFGEDAQLSAKLSAAYIYGFQGEELGSNSVACMTKHFSGAGPQEDGWDAHFESGINQVYPGNNFDYHLIPFTEGALKANTAQIMPYYGVPVGQTSEEVGFGFNKDIIQGLLRDSLAYDGVVCTDWGIISDLFVKKASAWGVENLSPIQRVEKVLDAGCDMFGGDSNPKYVVELVKTGKVKEDRIDESVRRVLRDKFKLGLFDNPFVNEEDLSIVGKKAFLEKGKEAQRKSLVLLKNDQNILPLKEGVKVFAQGFQETPQSNRLHFVKSPEEADFIILKLATPFTVPKGAGFLERMMHQGALDFPEEEKTELLALIEKKPTITVLSIDRPPVVPEINAASKAVIADFECEDAIIMELINGQFNPSGVLPLEIPSSMEAVKAQKEDVPYDSKDPLYPYGFGLSFN